MSLVDHVMAVVAERSDINVRGFDPSAFTMFQLVRVRSDHSFLISAYLAGNEPGTFQ